MSFTPHPRKSTIKYDLKYRGTDLHCFNSIGCSHSFNRAFCGEFEIVCNSLGGKTHRQAPHNIATNQRCGVNNGITLFRSLGIGKSKSSKPTGSHWRLPHQEVLTS
ncbi:hypothetical protein NPIL_245251 [Nephila pilipes]|uniref:Uncharacterized protein n=1 Tax=Nephila pilipes TaxID=299642 RepID=A0A8X6NT73_NEPPI|nr:hypothetical protein NPIL_245251 [Nephila pilipes]